MNNKVVPKTLPGFMELYPEEQILFNKIKNIIEDTYKSYGYYPLDTPIIESSSVLLAKAGGETEKQIYRFNKGDNDLSLRFDLTVPLAKYVASRFNELVFPFKRYQIGKVYRGERPQRGRFREFYQCDIDVIGDEELSLMYDAEMPSIIYDIFTKMNIGDFIIRINNRKILSGFFEYLDLKDKISDILRVIDKLEKIGLDSVCGELEKIDINKNDIDKIINFISIKGSNSEKIKSLKKLNINNDNMNNGINELEKVINTMKLMKINEDNYEIDLTIARGLDYYTGTVYETILKDNPEMGSICSGGRYDELAEFYTDKHLPGVGISIGLTRLFYLLREKNIINIDDASICDVLIIPFCENYDYIYNIYNTLRSNNINAIMCYIDKGFKQKMKYANKINTKYVIIIGEDEVSNNCYALKNMYTGEQIKYDIDSLIKALKK